MTTSISLFLDRYSLRSAKPDIIQLRALARAFSHLPYENVTKLLKEASSTGSASKMRLVGEVLEDHLRWNTGGTCFSLCNAFQSLLTEYGFTSYIAMADMHYGSNIHCAVIAEMDEGNFLLDPGYLLHDPIPLPGAGLEILRENPMNTVVIRNEEEHIHSLYTCEGDQKKWRYRIRAWPVTKEEFQQHWLHSFALNSMEHLLLSRADSNGRIYFRKDRLEHVQSGQRIKQHVTADEADTLSNVFGIPTDLLQMARKALLIRPKTP